MPNILCSEVLRNLVAWVFLIEMNLMLLLLLFYLSRFLKAQYFIFADNILGAHLSIRKLKLRNSAFLSKALLELRPSYSS